jgi:hypothetical protein
VLRIRERAPGVCEITVSTGRRDPGPGTYRQVYRTVHATARRPGAAGFPRLVEVEAAKMVAEVDVGGGYPDERHVLGELLDEYLGHQPARGRAPKTLLERGARRHGSR